MTILVLLLVLTLIALVCLGFYTIQLREKAIRLDGSLLALQGRFESETKQLTSDSESAKAKSQEIVKKYNEGVARWNEAAAALKAEIKKLSPWKNIADADQKAAEMLQKARATVENAQFDSRQMITAAQQQAAKLLADNDQKAAAELAAAREAAKDELSEAKIRTKAQRDEAQGILNSATSQSAKIIEAANSKAEEIGGSAYEALKNASLYERTVKAMRNIIEGYGDEYIIPEHSLLDDLAEDFGHTEAGQELKRAREHTNVMIRNGTAATCDYVEENRRETAINFVLDAFNGKVDSILSRTKHDNAGKLAQTIRDAFTLVNFNGKAFRDARITDEFLAARLEELRWAEVANLLALKEREEQRHAKEILREEAKARKEQERALREAAKEEEMLTKAITQAREQFEHASGEQKAMYEQRLLDMSERLTQALERKERARSMAEQTKKGHVYIISSIGSFGEDVYKIGLTRRDDPFDRVRELGDSSVPFDFDVHAMILCEDAPAVELQLHKHFLLRQMNKVDHRKEFFRVSLCDIRDEIEKIGLTTGVKWTMKAEAQEYRETLAIENAIQDSPAQRDAWINRQLSMEIADAVELEPVGAGTADD